MRWVGFEYCSGIGLARGIRPTSIWCMQKPDNLWLHTAGIYRLLAVVVVPLCSPMVPVGVEVSIPIMIPSLILSLVLLRKGLILMVDEIASCPSGCCLCCQLADAFQNTLVSRCLLLGQKVGRWSRISRYPW